MSDQPTPSISTFPQWPSSPYSHLPVWDRRVLTYFDKWGIYSKSGGLRKLTAVSWFLRIPLTELERTLSEHRPETLALLRGANTEPIPGEDHNGNK